MKDPKSFVKLFDLNVPVIEHLDYYIDQMSKTQKYKDIKHFLSLYQESEMEISDAYEFRKNKSQEIIDFIKQVGAVLSITVNKNTFIVIAKDINDDTGKAEDARKINIPIISLQEFKQKYL